MKTIDAIVIGGGIAGCMAAKALRRREMQVVLVEKRDFLGHEMTATGQTWLTNGTLGGDLPVPAGALKKYLLAEQYDAGSRLLFGAFPALAAVNGRQCCGLVLGTLYGLMELKARWVFDATPGGIMGALLGGGFSPVKAPEARYRFEMENVGTYYENPLVLPPELDIPGSRLAFHPQLKNYTVTAEFVYDPAGGVSPVLLAYKICTWLRQNVDAFREARLSALSSEPVLDAGCYEMPVGWTGVTRVPIPRGLGNVREWEALERRIDRIVADSLLRLPQKPLSAQGYRYAGGELAAEECSRGPYEDRRLTIPLCRFSFDFGRISRRRETSALVAGLGTAGAMAAVALMEEGVAPLIAERSPIGGGTSTVGYVNGFWHGYQGGINRERAVTTRQIAQDISGEDRETNHMAGFIWLHQCLQENPCVPMLGTILCGTLREGDRIAGALLTDDQGILAVDAKVIIDATGDAAVAYLAGLPYEYGDGRDGLVQTFSQWGREPWKVDSFVNSRYCMDFDGISHDWYSEFLRGILLAHAQNSDQNFSEMLTVRESRRIVGEYVLTMGDIYSRQPLKNCVAVTQTPIDTHGISSSIFAEMGLSVCKEELFARIPYGCYIPKGVDGLLVTGKSFSGTRDAVCVCRMNADLRNAGYAVGLAAAAAIREDCRLTGIDLPALQAKLAAKGVLPDWAFQAPEPVDWSMRSGAPEVIRALLESPQEARHALKSALSRPGDRQMQDVALAWFGDSGALGRCAQRLMEQPDDLACIAVLGKAPWGSGKDALLYALSQAVPGGKAAHKPTPYARSRIDGWRIPHYRWLLTLAAACGRAAAPEFCPQLERLLNAPEIAGNLGRDLFPVKPYMGAYLELRLGEALARCGGVAGAIRLAEFLEDVHYGLSEHAHDVLTEILHQDFGFSAGPWLQALCEKGSLGATPDQSGIQF